MENIILYLFSFILGTIIGSFLNVCIYRVPSGESIFSPPSHCPRCDTRLSVVDLVPLFSYVFLQGKCRHCGTSISWQYLAVELFTGVLFLAIFIRFGFSLEALAAAVLFCLLLVASVIDIYHRIIPNGIILTGFVLGLPLNILFMSKTRSALSGFLLGGGILLLVAVLSRGGMGGGDIKLAAVAGIYLGWQQTLLMLFLAFLTGSVAGIALVWAQKKTLKETIPFGPFLSLAGIVAMLFGNKIITWYWNLFR